MWNSLPKWGVRAPVYVILWALAFYLFNLGIRLL
jgi:hypothetical protein